MASLSVNRPLAQQTVSHVLAFGDLPLHTMQLISTFLTRQDLTHLAYYLKNVAACIQKAGDPEASRSIQNTIQSLFLIRQCQERWRADLMPYQSLLMQHAPEYVTSLYITNYEGCGLHSCVALETLFLKHPRTLHGLPPIIRSLSIISPTERCELDLSLFPELQDLTIVGPNVAVVSPAEQLCLKVLNWTVSVDQLSALKNVLMGCPKLEQLCIRLAWEDFGGFSAHSFSWTPQLSESLPHLKHLECIGPIRFRYVALPPSVVKLDISYYSVYSTEALPKAADGLTDIEIGTEVKDPNVYTVILCMNMFMKTPWPTLKERFPNLASITVYNSEVIGALDVKDVEVRVINNEMSDAIVAALRTRSQENVEHLIRIFIAGCVFNAQGAYSRADLQQFFDVHCRERLVRPIRQGCEPSHLAEYLDQIALWMHARLIRQQKVDAIFWLSSGLVPTEKCRQAMQDLQETREELPKKPPRSLSSVIFSWVPFVLGMVASLALVYFGYLIAGGLCGLFVINRLRMMRT